MAQSHISILFKESKKLSVQEAINIAKQRILNNFSNAENQKKYQDLEDYLNYAFYGDKNNSTDTVNRLGQAAVTYLEDHLQRRFDSYDFEKNMAIQSNTSGKIGINDYSATHHSERIQYDTVLQRFNEAKNYLENIGKSNEPAEKYQEIKNKVEQLASVAQTLLNREDLITLYGSKNTKVYMVTNETKALIDELDKLYQEVTFFSSLPLNMKAVGDIFERGLQAIGTGTHIDYLTDEILNEAFRTKTIGESLTSRGNLINYEGATVSLINTNKKGNPTTNIKYEVTGDNGSKFLINGAFDAKQGKMDVLFTMPDNKDTFRISAKNWSTINNEHDLGETDLQGALLRTIGLNPTLSYGLRAGLDRADNQVHQYARVCAALDIIMGYSQESAYADTLVINNRAQRHIEVFSIYDLLDKIQNNIETFKLHGYNAGTISAGIQAKLNYSRQLGPQNYISVILSELKNYKISVMITDIL